MKWMKGRRSCSLLHHVPIFSALKWKWSEDRKLQSDLGPIIYIEFFFFFNVIESLNVEISESLFITCAFSSKQLFTDERNTIYGSKQPRMDFHLGSHALLFLSFLFLPFWAIMYDSYFSFIGNHALLKIKKFTFGDACE